MPQTSMVLVTGAAGRIGTAVVRELVRRGYRVRAFDIARASGTPDVVVGDITDAQAVLSAAQGADAIVHLAATPDTADFLTRLLPNNIVGTFHVFEAARAVGVKRLALASSGQVVYWQRFTGPLPIRADSPPTPKDWYAATKLFQEAAGRAYAAEHGIPVIAARLGWCPRGKAHAEELASTAWGPDVYLSPGDAGRFFACAIEAPEHLRFEVVYACSRPVGQGFYDVAPARDLLGYEPRDVWPDGLDDGP